ncbi:MAG: hypothetical protein OXD29_00140 [Roseovarius sp.]|nr:hypothetical protein [Roseovarius sp.]
MPDLLGRPLPSERSPHHRGERDESRLPSGTGYTINPDMASVEIQVADDSNGECSHEAHIDRGGILYKMNNNPNDTGVRANKSPVVKGGIAGCESKSYATTELKWRTDSTRTTAWTPCQRPEN